jgi:GTP-binding protein
MREMRTARRQGDPALLVLDLDHPPPDAIRTQMRRWDAALAPARHARSPWGAPGYGNPHFQSTTNPSPKFATRGYDGTWDARSRAEAARGCRVTPDAGKSSLLRALTGDHAHSAVVEHAFTTLNPVVGAVRVAEDWSFVGGRTVQFMRRELRDSANRNSWSAARTPIHWPAIRDLTHETLTNTSKHSGLRSLAQENKR